MYYHRAWVSCAVECHKNNLHICFCLGILIYKTYFSCPITTSKSLHKDFRTALLVGVPFSLPKNNNRKNDYRDPTCTLYNNNNNNNNGNFIFVFQRTIFNLATLYIEPIYNWLLEIELFRKKKKCQNCIKPRYPNSYFYNKRCNMLL